VTKASEGPSAFDRAVRLLALRPHFVAEVERKLRQRGYEAGEIAAAIARLEELGYLDDPATAAEYVRLQRERKGWGRTRLRAELLRRGVSERVAAEVLATSTDEDELELARRELVRWRRGGGGERAQLARRLERKGFPARVIVSVLDEAGLDTW
jgi:regulatory protein